GLISMRLKKWALILVDPFSSGEPFKTTAREMGYKVIGIYTQTEDIYEKHHSSRAAREHDCDAVFFSSDIDTLVPSLKALPFSIQGCIPTLDMSVSVAMRLSDRLHLIGNPIDMLPYYRDKSFMRKRLRECSLPCPDFSLCHTSEEVRDFARSHTFPLVIKTPQGAGSEQVFICTTEEELLLHFREICEQPNTYGQRVQEAVVEEFLSGTEYIVDVFADGEKIHITDVWFYDKTSIRDLKNIYYNIISLPFDDPIVEKLSAATLRLCDAFKIQKGAVHFELKDDLKRGITLIEINVRLPGAGVPLLLRTTSNWDPFRSTIEVFTKGKTKLPQPIRMKHLAVVMCPLQQGGTVEKIEGIEEIQALPSYVRHVLYIHPGDQIDYTKHLFNLPYLVYLAHTDRAQLLKDVATAHQLFHIVYTRSTGKSA
ncbi:MAG: ATP-grasp domain-containing protein, partial [Verrucomicrobia bacterium]|nr:ATP-grasp domain-containing protein [Verrucomicrobiota bacterium]